MFGLFGRKKPGHPYVKQEDEQTFRVRVRTLRHGDVVEFRFTKAAHIGADEGGGYLFRKPVVSAQHFDRGELVVRFDARYNVTAAEGEGVAFIPVHEWED